MCGENRCLIEIEMINAGSPPHVRGKHSKAPKELITTGITPACAGKTVAMSDTKMQI